MDIARQLFVGKRSLIFRLPKKLRRPGVSGWCILPKDKWTFDGRRLSPSVIINFTGKPEHRRHFRVEAFRTGGGVLHLMPCPDDPYHDVFGDYDDARLPYIPRFWIEGLLDLLPPKDQVCEPGEADEDY